MRLHLIRWHVVSGILGIWFCLRGTQKPHRNWMTSSSHPPHKAEFVCSFCSRYGYAFLIRCPLPFPIRFFHLCRLLACLRDAWWIPPPTSHPPLIAFHVVSHFFKINFFFRAFAHVALTFREQPHQVNHYRFRPVVNFPSLLHVGVRCATTAT